MAPSRRPKAEKSEQLGIQSSSQFVFSVAAPAEPSAPVEFATNITPGTYKASTRRSAAKHSASKAASSAPKRFLPPSPVDAVAPSIDSHKKPDDASRIPRPPNAFILFRSSFIKGNHVDSQVETNHSTLSKIAGLTWNNLPEDQRQAWYDKAKDVRAAHQVKFPGYAFKPGNRDKQRKGRIVGPKDEIRCQRIAQLLVEGLSGDDLRDAMNQFDQQHVPKVVTRFEAPVTARSFRRRRSSSDTIVPEHKDIADHPPLKRRRKSPSLASKDQLHHLSTLEGTSSFPSVDPEMPPLCDRPLTFDPPSSFQVFSLSQDDSTQEDLFSFDQPPPSSSPGSDYSYGPLSPLLPPSPSCSSIPEEFDVSPKQLTIDTSFPSFDMGYLSSASSDSAPTTPFYEDMSNLSFDTPHPSFYFDAPVETCDPSSLNLQYPSYSEYPTQPADLAPCYASETQHKQQQDAFLAAAYSAWTQHQTQQEVSCHEPQSSIMPMPNMAQFMNMMAPPPQQHYV